MRTKFFYEEKNINVFPCSIFQPSKVLTMIVPRSLSVRGKHPMTAQHPVGKHCCLYEDCSFHTQRIHFRVGNIQTLSVSRKTSTNLDGKVFFADVCESYPKKIYSKIILFTWKLFFLCVGRRNFMVTENVNKK